MEESFVVEQRYLIIALAGLCINGVAGALTVFIILRWLRRAAASAALVLGGAGWVLGGIVAGVLVPAVLQIVGVYPGLVSGVVGGLIVGLFGSFGTCFGLRKAGVVIDKRTLRVTALTWSIGFALANLIASPYILGRTMGSAISLLAPTLAVMAGAGVLLLRLADKTDSSES